MTFRENSTALHYLEKTHKGSVISLKHISRKKTAIDVLLETRTERLECQIHYIVEAGYDINLPYLSSIFEIFITFPSSEPRRKRTVTTVLPALKLALNTHRLEKVVLLTAVRQ